jgi:carboxysome shell carbonic anhydrase
MIKAPPGLPPECGRHPLADRASSLALHHCFQEITAAFDAIEPVLRQLAPHQFEDGFARRGAAEVLSRLHLDFPTDLFAADWTAPLNMGILYARCILGTFCRVIERADDRSLAYLSDCESIADFQQRCRFHAIDITPCADGRLVDAVNYILRIPPSLVAYRKPYSGALFNVDESVRHWERTELRRWRKASPNKASSTTQYLKMCIYPFSKGEPADRSCAAQDGDGNRAVPALLARLRQFGQAVRLIHGEDVSVATLLVGVNTDTDAIRVHVPDAHGNMHAGRHLNGHILYNSTSALSHTAAKAAIQNAVAICGGAGANDVASAGMRWLCSYLLESNIAQLDLRREWRWPHSDSTKRLLVVGDTVDEAPMGNFALQAQMSTFEEGAAEIDNGINILRDFHEKRRLAIPLIVHVRVDPLMPGAVQYARGRASHLANEIRRRYDNLVSRGFLHIQAIIRDSDGVLLPIEVFPARSPGHDAITNVSRL